MRGPDFPLISGNENPKLGFRTYWNPGISEPENRVKETFTVPFFFRFEKVNVNIKI